MTGFDLRAIMQNHSRFISEALLNVYIMTWHIICQTIKAVYVVVVVTLYVVHT